MPIDEIIELEEVDGVLCQKKPKKFQRTRKVIDFYLARDIGRLKPHQRRLHYTLENQKTTSAIRSLFSVALTSYAVLYEHPNDLVYIAFSAGVVGLEILKYRKNTHMSAILENNQHTK